MSDNIENTEDFILWRETLDYVTDKNVVDMLVQTIHQLRAEVERLENLKYMGVNAEYVETNKQLRGELVKSNNLVEQWQEIAGKHEAGFFAVEYERDQLRAELKQKDLELRCALETNRILLVEFNKLKEAGQPNYSIKDAVEYADSHKLTLDQRR